MEYFEKQALETARNPLSLWLRYVVDTMTKIHEYDIQEFTDHINSIDEHIKFTSEEEEEGRIPFLDTCVHVADDGSTKTTVYRKPTHTDQYLNFQSNHHLEHKRSVVRTLLHRAKTLKSEENDQKKEIEHVKSALRTNGLPKRKEKVIVKDKGTQKRPMAGIPYIRGTSEVLARVFRKHGADIFHKPFNSIRQNLSKVKDKTDKMKKCGVIYHIQCEDCENDYVGETARQIDTRLKEHLTRTSSAIYDHCKQTGHKINPNNTKVLTSEEHLWKRKVKEAIEIKQRRPSLNRDEGLELPRVFDSLLVSRDPSPVM
ncbi:uncharacterized protein LOC127855937 [Dreissena polymorpha]|uniref:uncharacterized protein LOC127855937 n=1 Tax=Dreissena polymorpha TaxID=45954 RepID=UPI002263DC10|nr:uncharacterized protein LOC127855937 [Dreissena polymorpha]